MNYKIINDKNFVAKINSGEENFSLVTLGENQSGEKEEFLWKLEKNVAQKEETVFQKVFGGKRFFSVLRESVVLSVNQQSTKKLSPGQVISLDGNVSLKEFGKTTNYQLLVKDGLQGKMQSVDFGQEAQEITVEKTKEDDYHFKGIYVVKGYAIVVFQNREILINQGQQLLVEEMEAGETFSIMGQGYGLFTAVDFRREAFFSEKIPKEKATMEDFFLAMKIAHTNFRGSGYLLKSMRENRYDWELRKAMDIIDRFYLPAIIGLLGLGLVSFLWMEFFGSEKILFPIVLWLLLDLFFITPFLYFLVIPKPVKKHIKPVDRMTEYEKRR